MNIQQLIAVHEQNKAWVKRNPIVLMVPTGLILSIFLSFLSLTGAQVSCVPPPPSLVSWWPFDETGGTSTADIIDANPGTLVGGPIFTNGTIGNALSFDGINDYVGLPSKPVSNLISAQFTIEFWANPGTVADRPTFGFSGSGQYNTNNPIASYDAALTIGNGFGGYQLLPVLPDATANAWTHYAIVDDGTNYRLYVNGAQQFSQAITVNPSSSSNRSFVIGQSGFASPYDDFFNGRIDEFTIYSRALSSSEIQSIYNAGNGGKCGPVCGNGVVEGGESCDDGNTANGDGCSGTCQVESGYTCSGQPSVCTPIPCANAPSNMVSWWDAEGNANDIQDSNNGVLQNGATFAAGRIGQAFSLDGVDDYVLLGNPTSLQLTSGTIDAWIKAPAQQSYFRGIVVREFHYSMFLQDSVFGLYDWSTGTFKSSGINLADNNWHHVAVSFQSGISGGTTFYIDGSPVGTTTMTVVPGHDSEVVIIGTNEGDIGGQAFGGLIDEVEIFNRVLSPTEIQSIYAAGSAGKCRGELPPFVSIIVPNSTTVFDKNGTIIWRITDPDSISFVSRVFYSNGTSSVFLGETGITAMFWDTSTLADGFYRVIINVTDGLNNVSAPSDQFKIDHTAPLVNLVGPENNSLTNADPVSFSFIATDNLDSVLACSLAIDNTSYSAVQTSSGAQKIVSVSGISDGLHSWSVSCLDAAGHLATSVTRLFRIDRSAPLIGAITFANAFTGEVMDIAANITSQLETAKVEADLPTILGIKTITLSFNNATKLFEGSFVAPNQTGNFTGLIRAFNILGTKSEKQITFLIDLGVEIAVDSENILVSPSVPFTGQVANVSAIIRNLGGRDASNVRATLSVGPTNISFASINVSLNGSTNVNLPWDTTGFAGNVTITIRAHSKVAEPNVSNNVASKTVFVDGHDFSIASISFSPLPPVFSGEAVTVTATVQNMKAIEAKNVRVNFYQGLIDLDHLIGFQDILILGADAQTNVSAKWQTSGLTGNRTIFVVVNPDNLPAETDRSNNILNRSFELKRFVAEQIPDLLTFRKLPLFVEEGENVRGMTSNDFTGDGKIDFVVATLGGKLVLFKNKETVPTSDGKRKNVTFERIEIANLPETAQGLASADFSFDGFPDIIVGTGSGKVILFNNTNGTLSVSNSKILLDAGDDAFGLTVGDVDNDNDFDIVTGNRIGHVDFYVNKDDNSMLFEFNKTVTTRNQPYGLTSGDYDLDGHVDFMVGDREGQLERIVFEINKYNGFLFADIGEFAHGLSSADIDYSGKLDLIAIGFNGNINLYYSREGGLVAEPLIIGNKRESSGLTAADYDRDNDIDILVGSDNGEIILFENTLKIVKSFTPDPSPPLRNIQVITDIRNPYAREMVNVSLQEVWTQNAKFIDNFYVINLADNIFADVHFSDTPLDTNELLYHFYLDMPNKVYVRCLTRVFGQLCGEFGFTYNGAATLNPNKSFVIPNVADIFNHSRSLFLREGFKMEYVINATNTDPTLSAVTIDNYTLLGSFSTFPTNFLLSDDVSNLNDRLANAKNVNPLPFKEDRDFVDEEIRVPDFTPSDIIFTTPPPVAPNEPIFYRVTVKNLNNISIKRVRVAFIAEGNRSLGSKSIDINAFGTADVEGFGFLPTTIFPNVTAVVNPGNEDFETDFANNRITESIATVPLTDLAIVNITTDKKVYVEGEGITVNVTVKNIGTAKSFSSDVIVSSFRPGCGVVPKSLRLSCTPDNNTDLPEAGFCSNGTLSDLGKNIGNLESGQEITVVFSEQLGDLQSRSQGTYFISALVGNVGGRGKNIDAVLANNANFDPVPITVLPSQVDVQFESSLRCGVDDFRPIGSASLAVFNETDAKISFNQFDYGGQNALDYDSLIFLDNNDSLVLERVRTDVLLNHLGRTESANLNWSKVPPGDHIVFVYLDYGKNSTESTARAESGQDFILKSKVPGVEGDGISLSISQKTDNFVVILRKEFIEVRQTEFDIQEVKKTTILTIENKTNTEKIRTIGDLAEVLTYGGLNASGSFVDPSSVIEINATNANLSEPLRNQTIRLSISGSLKERIESDRHKLSAPFKWKEIVASELLISPSFVAPRDAAVISAAVSNLGDISSGLFTVAFEVDGEILEERVISLPSRGSERLQFNFTVPAAPKSEYRIRIIADSKNVIAKEDESNNIVEGILPVSADYELNILSGEYGNNKLSSFSFVTEFSQVLPGFENISMEYDASPVFVDYDLDGDLDLIVGSLNGKILSLRNQGSGKWEETQWEDIENVPQEFIRDAESRGMYLKKISTLDTGARSAPRFADINGDTAPELVVGDAHGRLQAYQREAIYVPGIGPQSIWNRTSVNLINDALITKAVPSFADLDSDGDADLIVGDSSGSLRGFEKVNDSNARYVAKNWSLDTVRTTRNSAPFLFDFDKDGDSDLLLGGNGELLLYKNIGNRSSPSFSLTENLSSLLQDRKDFIPTLTDLNKDGRAVLVVGSNNFTQLPLRRGYFEPVDVQIINYAKNEIELNRISLSILDKNSGTVLTHILSDGPFEKRLMRPITGRCEIVDVILSGYRVPAQDTFEKEYQINIPVDLPHNTTLAVTADKVENVNPPHFYTFGEGYCGSNTYRSGSKGSPIYRFNETLNASTFDIFVSEDMVYEINSNYRVFFNGTLSQQRACTNEKFCPLLDLTPGHINTIIGGGEIIRHIKRQKADFDIVSPTKPPLELFIENKFGLELKPGYIEDVIVSLKNNNRRGFEIDRIALELYDKRNPTGSFVAGNITFNIFGNANLIDLFTDTAGFSIAPGMRTIKTYKVFVPEGVPEKATLVAKAIEKHSFFDEQFSRNAFAGLVPEPSDRVTFGPVISSDLRPDAVYNASSLRGEVDERLLGGYPYSFLVHSCDGCRPVFSCEKADFNFLKKQFWIPQTMAKAEHKLLMTQICTSDCGEEPSHVTSWINGKNMGTFTTECNTVLVGWTPIAQNLEFKANNEFANFNFGPHRNLDYLFYEIVAVDFAQEAVVPAAPAIDVNVRSFGENNQLRRRFEEKVNVTFKNNDDDPRSIDVLTFDLVSPDGKIIHLLTDTKPIFFKPGETSEKSFTVMIPSDVPLNSKLRVTTEHIFGFPDQLWLRNKEMTQKDFLDSDLPDYHFGDTLPVNEFSLYRKHFFVPPNVTRGEIILGDRTFATENFLNGEFQGRGYPGWSPIALLNEFKEKSNNLLSVKGTIPETDSRIYGGRSFIGGMVTDPEEDVFFTVFGVREENLVPREPFRVFPGENVTARIEVENKYNRTLEFLMRLYTVDFVTLSEQTIKTVPLIVRPFETKRLEVDIAIPLSATNSKLQIESIWSELLEDKNWLRGSNFGDSTANNKFFDDSRWGVTELSPKANEKAIYYRKHIWVDSLTEKIKLRTSGIERVWVNGLDVPEHRNDGFFDLLSNQFTKSSDNLVTLKAIDFNVDADIILEHFVPVRSTDLEFFNVTISHCLNASSCMFNANKGEDVIVNFTLRNAGELFSEDFILSAIAQNLDTGEIKEIARERITSHPFSTDRWSIVFNTTELAGNFRFSVIADSLDVIIESSEANNRITMNAFVNAPPKINYLDADDLQGYNEPVSIQAYVEDPNSNIEKFDLSVVTSENKTVYLNFTQAASLIRSSFNDSVPGRYRIKLTATDRLNLSDSTSYASDLFDSLYMNLKTSKDLYFLGQTVKLTEASDSDFEKIFVNRPPELLNAYDDAELIKGGERITIRTNALDKDDDLITLFVCDGSIGVSSSGCGINRELCRAKTHLNPSCSFIVEKDDQTHEWFAYVFDSEGNQAIGNGIQGTYVTDSTPPVTKLFSIASSDASVDDQNDSKTIVVVKGDENVRCRFGKDELFRFHKDRSYQLLENDCISSGRVAVCNLGNIGEDDRSFDPITNKTFAHISCIDKAGNAQGNDVNIDALFEVKLEGQEIFDNYDGTVVKRGSGVRIQGKTFTCVDTVAACAPSVLINNQTINFNNAGVNHLRYIDLNSGIRTTTVLVNTPPIIGSPSFFDSVDEHAFTVQAKIVNPESQALNCSISFDNSSVTAAIFRETLIAKLAGKNNSPVNFTIICSDGIDDVSLTSSYQLPNQKPFGRKLPDISVNQNETAVVNLSTATFDPEGDHLAFALVGNSSISSLNINGSLLQVTGLRQGTEEVCIQVSDGMGTEKACTRLFVENPKESKIKNNEVTSSTINLLMKVQFFDKSKNEWMDDNFTKVLVGKINPGSKNSIKLAPLFDQWGTQDSFFAKMNFANGTFRVFAAAVDNQGVILFDRNGNPIFAAHNFTIINPVKPVILSGIPDQFLLENESQAIPIIELLKFTTTSRDPLSLRYVIVNQTDQGLIGCSLHNSSLFVCTPPAPSQTGSSAINISVSDGSSTDYDDFIINVVPILRFTDTPLIISCTPPLNASCEWQTREGDAGLNSTVVTAIFGNSTDSQTVFIRVNPRDRDGDNVTDDKDACPTARGRIEYQGCPFADKNLVELHIIDQAKSGACPDGAGSCKSPLAGVQIKVFDRNKLSGTNVSTLNNEACTGNVTTLTKNPDGHLYDDVFECAPSNTLAASIGCITGSDGICIAGEEYKGDYLVIVKYSNSQTGKTVYVGRPKSPGDFADTNNDSVGDLATKDFHIIKVLKKDGTIQFFGGSKTVITGSILEVIYPQYIIWTSAETLYPFIFTSDSNWEVNVCVTMPQGYKVVNGSCVQVFLANETKEIIFTVEEIGSPEPDMTVSLTAKHNGKVKKKNLAISGKRTDAYLRKMKSEPNSAKQ